MVSLVGCGGTLSKSRASDAEPTNYDAISVAYGYFPSLLKSCEYVLNRAEAIGIGLRRAIEIAQIRTPSA